LEREFVAHVTFITGGARSGKSRLAEELAGRYGAPLGYLATGAAGDGEMAARIARHQARRGADWQTMEEPLQLTGVLRGHDGYFAAILVDCVTLWLTNLLMHRDDPARVLARVRELCASFAALQTPLVIVSNEVGLGIVPDNPLARTFRDLAGEANELIAAAADEVYITFSGLPLKLK
jgi:adenosylcobinamide kinase / adenosylcobinamide-phosphate guanylyltransferase